MGRDPAYRTVMRATKYPHPWDLPLGRILVDRGDMSIWFRGYLAMSRFDVGLVPVVLPESGTLSERAFVNAFTAAALAMADVECPLRRVTRR